MGVLESLSSFLSSLGPDEVDITVFGDDIDVGDVHENAEVRVKSGESEHKAVLSEEKIVIFPDQLQGQQYAKFLQLVDSMKREEGRVTNVEDTEATHALETTEKRNIDETISFFESIISERHLSLLKSALYLRKLMEGDRSGEDVDINARKADLKDRYGYEAYYVSHLASSGYFDEDRYFRNLYFEIEEEPGSTPEAYRDEFERTVGEKLIAVFVNAEDGPHEVKTDVKAGITKHFRHQSRATFFDICGMGRRCRETIDTAIDDLSAEFSSMQYEDMDRGEERVVRIYPGTLRDFGL